MPVNNWLYISSNKVADWKLQVKCCANVEKVYNKSCMFFLAA